MQHLLLQEPYREVSFLIAAKVLGAVGGSRFPALARAKERLTATPQSSFSSSFDPQSTKRGRGKARIRRAPSKKEVHEVSATSLTMENL